MSHDTLNEKILSQQRKNNYIKGKEKSHRTRKTHEMNLNNAE